MSGASSFIWETVISVPRVKKATSPLPPFAEGCQSVGKKELLKLYFSLLHSPPHSTFPFSPLLFPRGSAISCTKGRTRPFHLPPLSLLLLYCSSPVISLARRRRRRRRCFHSLLLYPACKGGGSGRRREGVENGKRRSEWRRSRYTCFPPSQSALRVSPRPYLILNIACWVLRGAFPRRLWRAKKKTIGKDKRRRGKNYRGARKKVEGGSKKGKG